MERDTSNRIGKAADRDSAPVRVLLTGTREPTTGVLLSAMRGRAMFVETCPVSLAVTHLCRAKYEGLLVDMSGGDEALEVLRDVRSLTSNKGVVCCAVVDRPAQSTDAFRAGANFILEQPLKPEVITRTLDAAYPMMLLERRRYFRCSVQIRMYIIRQDGSEHEGVSINLSEGGMAFDSSMLLRTDETVQVRFRLPGENEAVLATGQVCWAQPPGRGGIQFTDISSEGAQQVQKWVADRVLELAPKSSKLVM